MIGKKWKDIRLYQNNYNDGFLDNEKKDNMSQSFSLLNGAQKGFSLKAV